MKITIAGAGIGGLSLALSLHDAGLDDIEIFESAASIDEIGVGINLLPHAVRELDELGLLPELIACGVETAALSYMTARGQLVWREPRGIHAGYRWPQLSIHRGQLLGILYHAVAARLGENRIHTDHRLSDFETSNSETVESRFVSRQNDGAINTHTADLLVGCDGVHSIVRSTLYPDEGPPLWNGTTMWRGVTVHEPFMGGDNMFIAGQFKHRVVVYPISKQHAKRGESLINWVCEKRLDVQQAMPKQDWNHQVDKDEVIQHFENFNFPFLKMSELIDAAHEVFQYPMVDRDPLQSWLGSRVTLLGDAAHPMYPVGSNGASQAIIDARILARELATQSDVDVALANYDSMRRPTTGEIVRANRQVGPERCIEIAEQRAPEGFSDIHEVITQEELQLIADDYKHTAGFNPDVLNNRGSYSV